MRCENAMVRDVLRRIRRRDRIVAASWVPILGRCIDLAYVDGRTITTVEFKLRDWRRALEQARDHRLSADHAYVCMPRRQVTEKMRSELVSAGIGLLFFVESGTWPFETVLGAPRSEDTVEVIRAELRARIGEGRRRRW
jgi:hypothetical protein